MSTTDRIHPTHIQLPIPLAFNDSPPPIFYSAPSSPFDDDDLPFSTPPIISDDVFYFPPPSLPQPQEPPVPPPSSEPLQSPDTYLSSVPSLVSLSHSSVHDRHLTFSTDDTFPTVADIPPPDFTFDDEGFTALEKIYLFSRSQTVLHRVFILHAMSSFLEEVTPIEAVTYVLPLLSSLAIDPDKSVQEVCAAELAFIIWWFFTNCQLMADDDVVQSDSPVPIGLSVHAFTPILGILLLSPNTTVSTAARYTVVNLLTRMRRADIREGLASSHLLTAQQEREMDNSAHEQDEQDLLKGVGLFGTAQRQLFAHEVLNQLVIGMGHLDEDGISHLFTGVYWDDATPENGQGSWPTEAGDMISTDSSSSPHTASIESDIEHEHPAIGRLSSMSLIAAVTASGSLDDDAQRSFVTEVERVARDRVWFVRSEAAFALGALAKVVPEEIVLSSLLPLFELLRDDAVWRVRHSALFALPAILPRLPKKLRRSLAMKSILSLAADKTQMVHNGVFESLGEVIYAFHHDPEGPPEELVQLFLGQDSTSVGGDKSLESQTEMKNGQWVTTDDRRSWMSSSPLPENGEPSHALVCAFNFPAVALTLGQTRWDDLRGTYLNLAAIRETKVRQTLAASLGELARIIGSTNARRDLVDVWRDVVRSKDSEVRSRAVGCVELFVSALQSIPRIDGEGPNTALDVVEDLLLVWREGHFVGWREREGIAQALGKLAELVGHERPMLVQSLLKTALEDGVAAVREAAISALSQLWKLFADRRDVLDDFCKDIQTLAESSSHRRRMTFVACQYPLVLPGDHGQSIVVADDTFWRTITPLADDSIVDVRIGVARLVGVLCDVLLRRSQPVTGVLLDLVRHLRLDSSPNVRSYVPELLERSRGHPYSTVLSGHHGTYPASWRISLPPPLSVTASSGHSIAVMQAVPADDTKGGLARDGTSTVGKMVEGVTSEPPQRCTGPETAGILLDGAGQQVRIPV